MGIPHSKIFIFVAYYLQVMQNHKWRLEGSQSFCLGVFLIIIGPMNYIDGKSPGQP
jgi:hypothetical protein